MSNDTTTKAGPSHRLYSILKNGNDKAIWTEIGAMWPHKDGKGFGGKLFAYPHPNAELAFREPKATKESSDEEATRPAGAKPAQSGRPRAARAQA